MVTLMSGVSAGCDAASSDGAGGTPSRAGRMAASTGSGTLGGAATSLAAGAGTTRRSIAFIEDERGDTSTGAMASAAARFGATLVVSGGVSAASPAAARFGATGGGWATSIVAGLTGGSGGVSRGGAALAVGSEAGSR